MRRPLSLLAIVATLLAGCAGARSVAPAIPAGSAITPQVVQTKSTSDFVLFTPKTAGTEYGGVVTGPDKNMWFTDWLGNGLVKMHMNGEVTEYPLSFVRGGNTISFSPWGITVGSDGKLYMTGATRDPVTNGGTIGVATTAGVLTVYDTPSGDVPFYSHPSLGPDGNVYFSEQSHLAMITPAGVITEWPYKSGESDTTHGGTVTGPDGNVWFTENFNEKVGSFNVTTHVQTEYDLQSQGFVCQAGGITVGPSGVLYYLCGNYLLGQITTSGAASYVSLPFEPPAEADSITAGPDGQVWFSAGSYVGTGKTGLAAYSPALGLSQYVVPLAEPGEAAVTTGPDKNIWAANSFGDVFAYLLRPITATPNTMTFAAVGDQAQITASEPNGAKLTATSGNVLVATVANGTTKGTFTVTAVGTGKTTVIVKDGVGNSFGVPVTVK